MEWKRLILEGFETSYKINRNGDVYNINTGHKKHSHENREGYWMMNIYYNHKWHLIGVHRLVALTFIPNPDNKPEVNHIDGKKYHNHVSNLEWATREENIRHAYLIGLNVNQYGFNSRHNIYSQDQITQVIERLKIDPSNMSKISRDTGVPVDTVFLIKSGKRYKDLSISLGFVPVPPIPRFDFTPYHDEIAKFVKMGYSNKKIRENVPIPVNDMVYNYYIRKVRRMLIM